MSPAPPLLSMQGWAGHNEDLFFSKVQGNNGFQKVMCSFSKASGLPLDSEELMDFAEELCRCCWHEADDVMSGEGPLAAAQEQTYYLKRQLVRCNLSTMKQIAALRSESSSNAELQEDMMIFHDSLRYVDDETKELVMRSVCDKVQQLQDGSCPPSFVAALRHYALSQGRETGLDELLEAQAELEQANADMRILRARAEDAEDLALDVRNELSGAIEALAELREQEAALRAEYEEVLEVCARHQAELEEERQAHQAELEEERQANVRLLAAEAQCQRAEVERQRLETDLKELEHKYSTLEQEAIKIRSDFAKSSSTCTHSTQTLLTGDKLEEQKPESKRSRIRDPLATPQRSKMQPSMSLPALHAKSPGVGVLSLDLGGGTGRRKSNPAFK
jgi:uncharacterized protein YhaN